MTKKILLFSILGVLILSLVLILDLKSKKAPVQEEEKKTSEVVQERKEEGKKMKNLSEKKILMIVAPINFQEDELLKPRAIFENNGAKVTIASKGVSEARSSRGTVVFVDKDISQVSASDFDAIIFVGGPGSAVYFDNLDAQKLAQDAARQEKVLGAICIAPTILANAGVLQGKKATVFSSEAEVLKAKGADYLLEDTVQDGKIVTASGPQVASLFGQKIAEALAR